MAKERKPLHEIFPQAKKGDKEDEVNNEHILPVREQIMKIEQKSNAHWSKGRAPLPPGHPIHLPKIGNYKPKALLNHSHYTEDSSSVYKDTHSAINDGKDEVISNSDSNFVLSRKKIDSNEDVVIVEKSELNESIPVQDSINDSGIMSPGYTENPLFGLDEPPTISVPSPPPSPTHGSVDFDSKDSLLQNPPADYPQDKEATEESSSPVPSPRRKKGKKAPSPPEPSRTLENPGFIPEEDYPYIPEPDYEADSAPKASPKPSFRKERYAPLPTVQENGSAHILRGPPKEGEDYHKYLSDEEDYEFDTYGRVNTRNGYRRQPQNNKKKSKSSAPRPTSQPIKSGRESKMEEHRRFTIRDFTFADSKMGYDDRTVRSTTAKGRYMKNKDRGRIEEGSYEEFLRNRYNENESNSSNDSGHETGEDASLSHLYAYNQRKLKDGRGSLWKKLTWRFRRHSHGYNMT